MRILLIEDHKLFRDGLETLLTEKEGIETVSPGTKEELSRALDEEFDLILLDLNLNKMGSSMKGLEIGEKLINKYPGVKIIFLTAYNLPYYRKKAKEMGAYGFVEKDVSIDELIKCIKKAVLYDLTSFPKEAKKEELTKREIEIVRHYASGKSRKETAEDLYMSISSLGVALNRIYQKLEVKNYQELVQTAMEQGYVDRF